MTTPFIASPSLMNLLNERAEQALTLMNSFGSLLLDNDVERWLDLFDEQIRFEFPYADEGYTRLLEGKQALAAYMDSFDGMIRMSHFSTPVIHQTLDPDLFIARFEGTGIMQTTGKSYVQDYISLVEVKNGKISRYLDYWNPLAVAWAATPDADQGEG
ncbi:nuclear transport factor 2 family protein [Paenibacillus sp. Z6-24]